MADIFMILLVFLLKSFSSGGSAITPTAALTLPSGAYNGELKNTLKLEIAQNVVTVDDKVAVQLNRFLFPSVEPLATSSSNALLNALMTQRKHMPVPNLDSNLLVLADQNTPYPTIRTVLGAAAGAGFVDLQMVIVAKE